MITQIFTVMSHILGRNHIVIGPPRWLGCMTGDSTPPIRFPILCPPPPQPRPPALQVFLTPETFFEKTYW